MTLSEWAEVAQIVGAAFSVLVVLGAFFTVRAAYKQVAVERRALEVQSVVRLGAVRPGVLVEQIDPRYAKVALPRDATTISVEAYATDQGHVAAATVPIRNVGNSVCIVTDVQFTPIVDGAPTARSAAGSAGISAALVPSEIGAVHMAVLEDDPDRGLAEYIAIEGHYFEVAITAADAAGVPRGVLRLKIVNVDGDLWADGERWEPWRRDRRRWWRGVGKREREGLQSPGRREDDV